jgi:hydrogenase/urease accessory protein HupE
VGAVAAGSLYPVTAAAHTVGVSQSDFTVEQDGEVRALIAFSRADAVRLGRMDGNGDGVISPSELEAAEAVFRALVETGIRVRAGGSPCAGHMEGGGDTGADGFGLSVVFACPAAVRIDVDLPFLSQLPPGHGHVLRISAGAWSVQKLLTGDDQSASLTIPSTTAKATTAEAGTTPSAFAGAVKLGIEHILRGWDHLLFLLALLLGMQRFRGVVAAVSAFTVAHSMTLALAALGVYAPSAGWVEPAIAASIAFVAVENSLRRRSEHRWRVTFLFGLLHGFGFAGALHELTLSRDRLVPTLLGFNLGVEVGQLAFIAVALPLLGRLRETRGFETYWARRVSMAVGFVGACLCIARIAAR